MVAAFMRKHTVWFALLIIVVLSLLGYVLYPMILSGAAGSQDSSATTVQDSVARMGDITLIVTGSGELVAANQSELGFQSGGDLLDLNVRVGDQVEAGDVLARLEVIKSSAQLGAEIAAAQLSLTQAEQHLEDLYQNAQMQAAEALVEMESAQKALEDLEYDQVDIAQARLAVASAQGAIDDLNMTLYILHSSPSETAIDITYSSLLFKERDLNELYEDVDRLEFQIKSAPNKRVHDDLKNRMLDLQVRLANMKLEVEKARYHYETMTDPADPIDLELAEAQMNTARTRLAAAEANLAEVQAGPSSGERALAQARLAEAQAEWQRWRDGPDPDEVALAEAQLEKARANLVSLSKQQLVEELVAPFDGTVIAVNAAPGDRIGNQSVVVLADMSGLILDVYLDESDSAGVQPGARADIVFDALPETSFTGWVSSVSPQVSRFGNTDAVLVAVTVNEPDFPLLGKLPLGINATVDIVQAQTTGAVLVPVEALTEIASGEYGVYVHTGDGYELRPVSIGLSDFTSVEILDGLSAGETVAIGNIESLGKSQ